MVTSTTHSISINPSYLPGTMLKIYPLLWPGDRLGLRNHFRLFALHDPIQGEGTRSLQGRTKPRRQTGSQVELAVLGQDASVAKPDAAHIVQLANASSDRLS